VRRRNPKIANPLNGELHQNFEQSIMRCRQGTWLLSYTWLFVSLISTSHAHAALGGDRNSVLADQVHFQAKLQTTQSPLYTLHEIQLPTGTVVREYENPLGQIFAVTWQGAWPPDLKQLLGSYFPRYADAFQSQSPGRVGRRPFAISDPDFVAQHSGRMRSFSGRAYLPQSLPAGVTAEAIQ
jgi:uncharacterized protein DUF2844